jgi:pimeloyl-ACP methyl ester carboxylesterase
VFSRLPEITVETLVMTGAGDPWIDPENARILAEQIPNAELYIVKDTRHGFMMEKPDEVNRVILDFLARREAAAA